MEKHKFYYFSNRGEFYICDLEYCGKSDRTFDMPLHELANNPKLLDKLNLIYPKFSYKDTFDEIARYFCAYLSAFFKEDMGRYEKSLTNPTIRLLIENDTLLQEIKTILP